MLALLVAVLMPAPQQPAEDAAGLGLALLSAGCVAVLGMGVLALLALPLASVVLGAVAWLLVTPCIWLARAPQPPEDWLDEDEQDDDGGSPTPDAPSAPPVPAGGPPGLRPVATPAAATTWVPAPQVAPVVATAARVQRLLSQQQIERLRAAEQVERVLAAAKPTLPEASDPAPVVAPEPVSLHRPEQPLLRPVARLRGEHGPIADVPDAVHVRNRRGAPVRSASRAADQL